MTNRRKFNRQAVLVILGISFLLIGCGTWPALFAQAGPAATAASKREERLAEWYNADSKGGLFVHWGLGTGRAPGSLMYPTMKAFEEATAAANWSPQPMVDAAVKLNCKYIVWATMHVEHGLLRTWKSKIPGTPVTQRDYLGELCQAAALKGIKIVVYMSGDAALQKADVKSFIDGTAYAAYKHLNIDIKNKNSDWVRYFVKDVMLEMMDNYPNVIGFWCDGWNLPSADTATLSAVHAKNKHYLIFRNEYSNQPSYNEEDVMGIEPFAKILSPAYDKASGMYVPSGNGIEGSFLISAEWWHTGKDYSADPKWCVKMAGSALGGNAVPCYAEGPTISGAFVPTVNATNDALKKFFDYASAATNNVWGGGYSHGGFRPGAIGDGAYVATTMSKDGNTHYIHVLNKPVTHLDQLVMPALGYKITGVKLVGSTGKDLTYSYMEDNVMIKVDSWADFDTYGDEIIEITTAGKPDLLSRNGWRISTNNADSSHPVSNAIDAAFDTYYSSKSNAAMPVEVKIDMGGDNDIYGINLSQYEGRALTTARYYPNNEGTRIKDFEIYTSSDGANWGSPLVSGTLANERGVQEIQVPQGTGRRRYLKLKILSNYKGNGVVQITEINVCLLLFVQQQESRMYRLPGSLIYPFAARSTRYDHQGQAVF
jgi:alpha-L-fucosidase